MNFALTSNLFRGFGHHRNDVPPLDLGRLLRDLLRDHRLRLLKEEVEVGRGNGRRVTVLDPVAEDEVARLVDVVVTVAFESAALLHDVVAVVGPGEKAADEHFPEYVQAAVVDGLYRAPG